MTKNPIRIAGGGLAGLSLGIALRLREIPVTLYEAGNFPRHRVCGEFLCGAGSETLRFLGIEDFWADATPNFSSGWYDGTGGSFECTLPFPALGLSRRLLDARLAGRFRELGGDLHERRRLFCSADEPGLVAATGRKAGNRVWLGLKAHYRNVASGKDLEMHFGRSAYVGLSRIEDGIINVCGLFARRPAVRSSKEDLLLAYLRATGLEDIAVRLSRASCVAGSETAVTGLDFTACAFVGGMHIGDSYSAIPPFTGNGMSMALEGAAMCVEPLVAFYNGTAGWDETCRNVRQRLKTRFSRRMRLARTLHPFLLTPGKRRILFLIARARLLPFNALFHALR